jgi:hypothetical protein
MTVAVLTTLPEGTHLDHCYGGTENNVLSTTAVVISTTDVAAKAYVLRDYTSVCFFSLCSLIHTHTFFPISKA